MEGDESTTPPVPVAGIPRFRPRAESDAASERERRGACGPPPRPVPDVVGRYANAPRPCTVATHVQPLPPAAARKTHLPPRSGEAASFYVLRSEFERRTSGRTWARSRPRIAAG